MDLATVFAKFLRYIQHVLCQQGKVCLLPTSKVNLWPILFLGNNDALFADHVKQFLRVSQHLLILFVCIIDTTTILSHLLIWFPLLVLFVHLHFVVIYVTDYFGLGRVHFFHGFEYFDQVLTWSALLLVHSCTTAGATHHLGWGEGRAVFVVGVGLVLVLVSNWLIHVESSMGVEWYFGCIE